ncbi:cyclic nucleotide binding regulatory protein [Sporocytophaga myxococcoides]|uniref:Cyclic nucleotide binding regulatory protein n=2 Tax=Sporocytophaga myxococcoides TaxID=153721 RepID=A0A098LHU1_9BACT|nr:cyclic nucleotide binding regulatory protein [Sporocytophaga myxococcoides]
MVTSMKKLLRDFITGLNKFEEDEIQFIVENTDVRAFQKGEIIQREGNVCDTCYFVLKGCIRQYQLADGEERTTAFFIEGEPAVLYSSYLEQAPSAYWLVCTEDCILITGTREQEYELHRKYPKLKYLVHTLMTQDYSKIEYRMNLLNHHKPEERYRILMKMQPELLNRVPLHQIASYIGVTPESFSRIRKRLMENDKSK